MLHSAGEKESILVLFDSYSNYSFNTFSEVVLTRLTIRNPDKVPARWLEVTTSLGRNIAAARKRRRLRQVDVATMAGITLPTLRAVESGNIGTSLGAYVGVLWALGLEDALLSVAHLETDVEGQIRERASLKRGLAQPRISRARLDDNF